MGWSHAHWGQWGGYKNIDYGNYGGKKKKSSAAAREASLPFYTLSMAISFPNAADTAFLAQCYPYTFSRLQKELAAIGPRPDMVRREKWGLPA